MEEKMTKNNYKCVPYDQGRQWILRVETGNDIYEAIQKFAVDNNIKFARVHNAFMGGFEPANYLYWTPDSTDPDNWHHETMKTEHNLTMILSMSGFIHLRKTKEGNYEPFPAIHFIAGAGWNVDVDGGHLLPGTIVKGNLELFVSEILNIDVARESEDNVNIGAPENWYKSTK
jgi:predicted DNA-binding protein with PD1-like motif